MIKRHKGGLPFPGENHCYEHSRTNTLPAEIILLPLLPPGEASGISDCPRADWGEGGSKRDSDQYGGVFFNLPSPRHSPGEKKGNENDAPITFVVAWADEGVG